MRRERYLDVLRVVALVRVVTYHNFGGSWLPILFPSMGIMFALAGSLTARSLERKSGVAVVRSRARRLLPPFWLFAAVVLVAAAITGRLVGGPGLSYWLVPVTDPPTDGSDDWFGQVVEPLWYLRTYLWFVALSPLAYRAYRRWPRATVAAPLLIAVAVAVNVIDLERFGPFASPLDDAVTFAACWVLGFARSNGALRRLKITTTVALAVTAMGLAVAWAITHPTETGGHDPNDIPLAGTLWSVGAVLLLLRATPELTALDRMPGLRRLIEVGNARAVTIYLWHEVALVLAVPITDQVGWYSSWAVFGVAWVLIGIAILTLGWAEDLAAGRRPRLIPGGASPVRVTDGIPPGSVQGHPVPGGTLS